MTFRRALALATVLASLGSLVLAQNDLRYQLPPKGILDLIDVDPTPSVSVSPPISAGTRWILLQHLHGLPPIADLAQPELRLAGLRFNPKTNGPSRTRYSTALGLQALPAGKEVPVTGLPKTPRIIQVSWSPDARHVAFANISDAEGDAGLSLWVIDVAKARAERIPGIRLNGLFETPYEWMPDSQGLLCKVIPAGRGEPPKRDGVPVGPVIQENLGTITPSATYEDLLKNPVDEQTFDYYAVSQVERVGLDGKVAKVGEPGVVTDASPSPDGAYVLIDEIHRPYSYLLPYDRFPEKVSVINLSTGRALQLVDKPLQDKIPDTVHDAVAEGRRDFGWRNDAPATVSWAEAGDGGDPRKDTPVHDSVFLLAAPFDGTPSKLLDLPMRLRKIEWSSDRLSLVEEGRWSDRKRIILAVAPNGASVPVKVVEVSSEDSYHDPGKAYAVANASGKRVLLTTPDGVSVYFVGPGSSPEGYRPFVSTISTSTGEVRQLWQSAAPHLDWPEAVLDASGPVLLVDRQSPEISPNFHVLNVPAGKWTQITFFPSPYGSAPIPRQQILKYKRADGVDLSANLYLPDGYKAGDGPLPTLIEAYPTEFKTRDSAGQFRGSPYFFPRIYWGSPIPFVTQGYAVLENATIPIVGEGKTEPNDTYVEQLVASAKAAIDEGVRLGVVDPNRVAVMGHSYGAFMTVNLLAHSTLFRAGIARSGAYNRTLTPFGFQNEERTYWQAPQVYFNMSPFSFADRIKTPLLLIHGEADNNSGTFPIQSERLFSAIKGHGGTVRFVLLPLESHGYAGRESVLHMFWEMNTWLDKYVKNAPPAASPKP